VIPIPEKVYTKWCTGNEENEGSECGDEISGDKPGDASESDSTTTYQRRVRRAKRGKKKAKVVQSVLDSDSDSYSTDGSHRESGSGGFSTTGRGRKRALSSESVIITQGSPRAPEVKRIKEGLSCLYTFASQSADQKDLSDVGLLSPFTWDPINSGAGDENYPGTGGASGSTTVDATARTALATTTNVALTSIPHKRVFSPIPAVTFNPWQT
jgi:hypothetical protein